MKIGIPKEIKNHEYRVGANPELVHLLIDAGHEVWIQEGAGAKIGYSDNDYEKVGAQIRSSAKEIYSCPLVVKVKEPQREEMSFLNEGQIIFGFFHLSAEAKLAEELVKRKVTALAFETVEDQHGFLPLLMPMSEVAGRIAVQAGAFCLQMTQGGKGLLLGGVPGVAPAKVAVLGGGSAGTQAATMAMGLGADVTILEKRSDRLRTLDFRFNGKLKTLYSTPLAVNQTVEQSDLVIGAVLIPGKRTPRLISRSLIERMSVGSAFVDIAIDQGGCSETSRPTSHSNPIYIECGVVHYCVTNMPGAAARTSTIALSNMLAPYLLKLANLGLKEALKSDPGFLKGLNTYAGKVTFEAVAEDLGFKYTPPLTALD